jgi:hypothetical protein
MDIKDIVQHAKEVLLQDGDYTPTFFVEREDKKVDIIVVDWLEDTTRQKIMQFFGIARRLAEERHWKFRDIKEIIFIIEAWKSTWIEGEPRKYAQPADDPERKEVLIVSKLVVIPAPDKPVLKTTMQTIEMLRVGDILDLLPAEDKGECDHRLLKAFMAGIASHEYSGMQLAAMAGLQ